MKEEDGCEDGGLRIEDGDGVELKGWCESKEKWQATGEGHEGRCPRFFRSQSDQWKVGIRK